jgi:methionyl-tRNA formyltransferase
LDTGEKPGTVIKGFPDELRVATGRQVLSIFEIQSESGKRLPASEFFRGYRIPPGTRFNDF